MTHAVLIAEAGVNHNGSAELAQRLVETAAAAGADAVKFQTFKADRIATGRAPKAGYQISTTDAGESQVDMLRRLELSEAAHRQAQASCRRLGIAFLSTPFDLPSLDFLVDDLGLATIKLPSGEITNGPLLRAAAAKGVDIILSTGMASLGEVEAALGALAHGYLGEGRPSPPAFAAAFASREGRDMVSRKVTLLHCTTEYPAPFASVNLRAMDTLAQAFGCPVGLSDHTPGVAASVAAVARGARMVEKHFTLDKTLPGPDHHASLDPGELALLVRSVREVEAALGDGVKQPDPCELSNRAVARKSLVTAGPVRAGQRFGEAGIAVKRPGDGVSPMEYWTWLERVATRDYEADEVIEP
jgi:N-acetylneuraminate synthase